MSEKQKAFEARKASLKLDIIKFLDEKCDSRRCLRADFWSRLSKYTKKNICHSKYGVSKMSNIFPEFQDILHCDERFVYLRKDYDRAIVVSSDSEDTEEENLNNSSITKTSSSMKKGTTPWGSGLMTAPVTGSRSKPLDIPDDSDDDDEQENQSIRNSSTSQPKDSGFIAFTDGPSRGGSGQPSHQRYGLQHNQQSRMSHTNTSQGPAQFMNSQLSVQAMAQNFLSQFGTPKPSPGLSPLESNRSNMTNPQTNLMGPLSSMPIQQQQQAQQGNFLLQTPQSPLMAMNLPPSGAMAPPPPPQPVASEWPQQRPRTGPPPGTKITETAPDIIVRPIRLPPNSRLTSEQVNSEIETCRELLADAGECVSLERVQSLVLQKFQVHDFRRLNLREKYFENMPAGRDLSMIIGKVNSYIHNFVRSRSMCTLFELAECCREFHSEGKSFDHLKLGPLQKMPLVYDLFKFPHDEYIPEITTIDLMEHLNHYLTKYQKWTEKTKVDDFMKYLCEEAFKVESAFSLGVRMRSLPLAIQTMKKAQRDSASTRRNIMQNLMEVLNRDVHEAFAKFRASLMQTSEPGKHELRQHYLNLTPEVAIREIFTKFELLSHVFSSDHTTQRKIERVHKTFQNFISVVLEVPIPRMLYHLSVCLSNLEVQESATEFMEQQQQQQVQAQQAAQQQQQQQQQQEKKVRPSKAKLIEKILSYLQRSLESGQMQLSYLQTIETHLIKDFQLETFSEMGYGRFLELLLKEPKLTTILEECGGTMLGSSSKGHHSDSSYRPGLSEIQELLCQANHAGLTQPQQMESVLCEQYHISNMRQLGHGNNIDRLWRSAQASRKHSSREQNVHYEAALCGKLGRATCFQSGNVGILGSQTREAAEACLTMCPLLEDMAAWSQWGLVFQPQFGPLRVFIEKNGGQRVINLKGKPGVTATSDFMGLEVEPGRLLKICTFSGPEQFEAALLAEDSRLAAGHLVSLIVTNKGVEGAPLALLANHVKNTLLTLHARTSAFSTPGGPPSLESQKTIDLAVQFVVQMLLAIPLRICVAVAEQVLLKPLSEAVGSDKSKAQVVLACQARPQDLQRVEQLGCLLGITEWCSSLQPKLEFPSQYCVAEIVPSNEDLFGLEADEEEEDEEDDDSSESDEDSDMDEMLSPEETDNAEESNEKLLSTAERSTAALDDTNNSNVTNAKDEIEPSNKASDSNKSTSTDSSEDDDDDSDDVDNDETPKEEEDEKNKCDSNLHADDKMQENNGDQNMDQVGKAMEILTVSSESKELSREEACHIVVDNIRREEFGVGIELGETEQKLMKKQQERQGRSLLRLSKDLYSKDTHFVLELIQNADDNSYPMDVVPAVKFLIDHSGVKVMNNESGFEAKNIQALCDVGKSTKTKHTIGYIGQKGIGFKSVFRVTSCPEVHSNGFHICFDVDSGPMGYILPHWIEPPDTTESSTDINPSWQTLISLPWTEAIKQQIHTHAARFNDIKPSLLLFLHRLREITIDNKVDGVTTSMKRKDLGDGEIQISHSGTTDRWLVVRKVLDASKVSIQMKAGVEVDSTEIALSFPLRGKKASTQVKPPMLPVFAFLPLRTYGFRFIVQGDFDVPSSREDVDKDSSWNQWLRSEIHNLFIEALEAFKNRPDLTPLEALIQYLQFVPLENEVVDFFKPVTTHILTQLRASKCMPVLNADGKGISWKLPSQCVLVRDSLVQEVVSPKLLEHSQALHYLHPELSNVLDQPLAEVLKVQTISTNHLLDIAGSISQNWDGQGHPDQVMEVAKWMACIYRSLDDFEENSHVYEKLKKMRVIPLADGTLVALEDVTVFLLMENTGPASKHSNQNSARRRDPLKELQKDLKIVHTALTSTPDAEINSQVVKLLLQTGEVKQLTAHDLIHSHIMPVLSSDTWKSKSREIIISYLIYMKAELDREPNLIERSELKSAVRLATNHGILSPQDSSVHFSTAFGNKIDLPNTFPGVEWTLVDAAYLTVNPTVNEKQSWHSFLTDLGVVDFLRVKSVEIQFDKSTIHESPWAVYKELWVDSPDGYVVTDYECKEFHQLVSTALSPSFSQDRAIKEMAYLFELLDAHWSTEYKRYTLTQLRSGSGQILKEVIETSFALHLKTLPWIPAEWKLLTMDEDGKTANVTSKQDMCKASDIYVDCVVVRKRLSHTVKYLKPAAQSNSHFIDFLGIKTKVTATEAKQAFISWCERHPDKPNTPAIFCTTWNHIFEIYSMIENELVPKEAQDVFHNHPAIFVPVATSNSARNQVLVGKMMARKEVWWHDPTGLFAKYRESLQNYKSPLGMKSTLQHLYGEMESLFRHTVRPDWDPTTIHLAQLLQHVASTKTLFEEGTLEDCLSLFSHIGARLAKIGEKIAGVPSHEASRQEAELQPVLSLLSDAAVFPSHRREWVNSSQQLLMLSDSVQLEDMFRSKPGVHFLLTELPKNSKGKRTHLDKSAIQHFVSLFESIKALSDCVTTEEITTGFQQCSAGQTYLHRVVGLIQRFLYFVYPEVYMKIKPGRAEALKQLIFVEVNRLEAKYELEGHPEIYVIQPEKCMVKDNMFYFHQAHSSSQAEINREISKYFSSGDKSCLRGLLSFLTQAVPILEGKSGESMQSLLSRQDVDIGDLPEDEDVWEVPLPIIQEPEPEPEPEPQPEDTQMVYGRELDPGAFDNSMNKDGSGENAQSEGIKSWPPRSALNVNESQQKTKKDSDKADMPAGMWPPPKPPNSSRSAKTLPSNIRVEREISQEEKEERKQGSDDLQVRRQGNLSRQNSHSEEGDNIKEKRPHGGDEGEIRHRAREGAGTEGTSDHSNRERREDRGDGSSRTQSPNRNGQSFSEDPSSGEKRKRKASESLREGERAVTKRFNSQTDEDISKEGGSVSRDPSDSEGRPSGHGQGRRDRSQDASHQERSGFSSNTEVTSSSSGTSQDSTSGHNKDRRGMHFTIPMWSELNLDLKYTDLSKDISAKLPGLDLEDMEHEQTDQDVKIGRWGEMLVLDYLMRLKDSDSSIEAILWANAEGEKGLPWDFEIVYYGMEGPENSHTVYVEVKTTVTQDREIFEVSRGQLELALKEGQNFQVYRVFGAGKPEPRLLRVDNVAERMRTKQLKLYMVL